MKVAQPPIAPIPDRKPDPASLAATGGEGGGFRSALADLRTGRPAPIAPVPMRKPDIPLILDNGQKVPDLPAAKPDAPIRLANGQKVPDLPMAKPEPPLQLANGQEVPPLPGAKPDPLSSLPRTAAAGRIVEASQRVAGLSGHSFTAILAQATQESGLDPSSTNKSSSAAGPFQFLERTWLGLFRRYGSAYGLGELAQKIDSRNGIPTVKDPAVRKQILDLRHDVDVSAGMAARYLAEGRERLSRSLHRPASETESRIAYVMGVGGAARLIKAAQANPTATAADLLPQAAKANHNLFHDRGSGRALTAGETIARLTRRMETDQREMFAAIARAAQPPTLLDGSTSPMAPFRMTDDGGGASPGAAMG